MKRVIGILLLAVFLCGCVPVVEDTAPVSMVIATDLHMIAPSLTEDKELFMQVLQNGDGKVTQYSAEIADAFFAEVEAQQPDYLILAGDNTWNGAAVSHELLLEKLDALEAAGVDVLLIPGNHDVDSSNAVDFQASGAVYAPAMSSEDFISRYAHLGPDMAMSRDENSFSYMVQTDSSLRILMLDANCYGIGFVKDGTLAWLETQLKQAKRDKAPVMAVVHQNLYAHSSLISFGYQLYNAQAVQELFEKYGVKVCFSGHIHIQSLMSQNVTEVVTASLSMEPVQYGEIVYDGGQLSYNTKKVDVSGWAAARGIQDENLLDFENYAVKFFEDISRSQVRAAFAESSLTEEEVSLMAETFARVNTAYFAGTVTDFDRLGDGLALWKKQEGSFFTSYIDTMLAAESIERRSLSLRLK